MNIYDFMMLGSEDQFSQIMANGTLVTKLHYKSRFFLLYSLNNFFFELEYLDNPETSKKGALLLRKRIFSSGVRMEKYLKEATF